MLIQNRGLTNSGSDIEINFTPLNNWISFENEPFTMSEIDARDSDDVTLTFTVSPNAIQGISSGIIVNINSENSYSRSQSIDFVIGEPQIVFFDNFENDLDEWETNGDWGLTSDAAEGLYALTDSPDGDYQDGQETFAEYVGDVDLQFVSNSFIIFSNKCSFVKFSLSLLSKQSSFTFKHCDCKLQKDSSSNFISGKDSSRSHFSSERL